MASIRVADEPAFVLHSIPYKETSLILDVFTRQYGRMALIAKGAKRPHSVLRPVLQRFQPLLVSWSGKSELRTLTKSEWVGGTPSLVGDALLCGFYLNELLKLRRLRFSSLVSNKTTSDFIILYIAPLN